MYALRQGLRVADGAVSGVGGTGGDYIIGSWEGLQIKGRFERESEVETDNEKRRRFDALAPVEVSSEEVRKLGHGDGYRRRVLDWIIGKKILGEYRNADKGWNIAFNNRSVRNVMGHTAGEGKIALLESVPELIKNGIYLDETDNKGSYVFAAKAKIDNDTFVVGFAVRADTNGKRYYDHAIRLEKGWAETKTRGTDTTAANPPYDPDGIINILKKHLGVNSKAKKISTACG